MNASDLKYHVEQTGSNFFDRKTMKFFGDTMANYGVRSATIETYDSPAVDVWELYRRRAVKHGLKDSAYFSKATFGREFKKRN